MAVTVKSNELKASLKALSALIDDVRIVPDDDGWHMYAMSADKTMIVDTHIKVSAFEEYGKGEPFTIAIKDLLDPLAKAAETTVIDTSTGRLRIRTGRISFIRPIQADIEVTPRFPSLELNVECIADVDFFGDLLSVTSGDVKFKACRFRQTAEDLRVEVFEDGSEFGEVMRIPASECVLLSGEATARFGMYAISQIIKSVPKGTEVDMLYDDSKPMIVSYSIGDADIRFMLAPQWETEDEEA